MPKKNPKSDATLPKTDRAIKKEKKAEDEAVSNLVDIGAGTTGYMGNSLLKRVGEKIAWTPEYIQEYKKCKDDPVYFSKYVTIVTLDHGKQKIKLYDYQKKAILQYKNERLNVTCSCRQSGKCVNFLTLIKVRHDDYNGGEPFEITIGAFYEWLRFRQWANQYPELKD